ncbi:hypothetical protein LR48_Vigan02g010800, partial [Vigna angularis]
DSMVITSMANALKDPLAASEASSSSIVDERMTVEIQKKQRTTAWVVSPNVANFGLRMVVSRSSVMPLADWRGCWVGGCCCSHGERRRDDPCFAQGRRKATNVILV